MASLRVGRFMYGTRLRSLRPWVAAILIGAVGPAGCVRDPEHARATAPATDSAAVNSPPPRTTTPTESNSAWFKEITDDSGVDFRYTTGATGSMLLPEIMGAGLALFDADMDGRLDIYFTNGHRGFPARPRAEGSPNRFYRQTADGRFEDVTERSGLGDAGYGMGVTIGDIDNDGFDDVLVTNLGPDRLYRNRGDGTFDDITDRAGIAVDGWSASACFFDYDADGYLDIYITRYLIWNAEKKCFGPDGRVTYCGPLSFPPIHDVLLHNDGNGTFTDVTERAGISSVAAAGLGVVCQDLNGDGRQDVYVANDAYANQLWTNQGDGTFRDEAFEMGAAYNVAGAPEAGMGVVAADFDNDGHTDLYMTHLSQESNTLYRNMGGNAGFNDMTSASGLSWSSIPYTGFGVAAFDVELDGDLDIAVVNGRVKRGDLLPGAAVPSPWDVLAEPSLFYLNDGGGRFESVTATFSAFTTPVEIRRGLAAGDLDLDGDLDLVLTNIEGPARIYRNDAPRQGNWLTLRAFDPRLNRDAIGARITLACGDKRYTRAVSTATSYLSSSDSSAHFGLPRGTRIEVIRVDWPDGLREHFTPPAVDSFAKLVRGTGAHDENDRDPRLSEAEP